MGRKAKYSKEFKLEIVKRYLKGESASLLANEYSIGEKRGVNIIGEWVRKYNTLGDKAFEETFANKSYSKNLKEQIIKEYLEGKDSYEGLANKYNIPSKTIVINWVKKYNDGIETKDYDPKGDVYTMKSRKTTLEEKLEIINYVLANDFDYKSAADKYTVPYASVYNWVKKYNECGEDGLKDSRGRPSSNGPKKELTIEEKQAIEIEKLKNELKRKDMVIEVLKKNIEIQERMERDSRLLNKKINTKR
jgi:transposase-like protein